MKILFYGINYAPELTGIGKYSGELCEWLAIRGHDVHVVTAPPYYPAWKISPGYSKWRYKVEELNKVGVLRCPLWVPRIQNGRNRVLHLLSFVLTSLPGILYHSLLWRPDVIIVIEPPLVCAVPALFAARLCQAIAWLHIQDLEIDAAVNSGLVRKSKLLQIICSVESLLLKHYDVVSSITKKMLLKLSYKGLDLSSAVLFQNWIDTSIIKPSPAPCYMRTELGLHNKIVALYSGNMGNKQGLEIIIDAAKLLRDNPDIIFVMCGDGAKRIELEKAARELPNIIFLPLQPLERLNELLNLADIHLLTQLSGMDDLVMPSKLLGMLASGRPIIGCVSKHTELAEIISSAGLVVSPGRPDELADAILAMASNQDMRASFGNAGRAICTQRWEKESILQSFEDKLYSVCKI